MSFRVDELDHVLSAQQHLATAYSELDTLRKTCAAADVATYDRLMREVGKLLPRLETRVERVRKAIG